MFSSIQSIPGLIFARSDVKAKIRPGVEASIDYAYSLDSIDIDDQGTVSRKQAILGR